MTSLESANALLVTKEDNAETADSTPVGSGEMKPNVKDNGLETSDVELHQTPAVRTSPRITSSSSSSNIKSTTGDASNSPLMPSGGRKRKTTAKKVSAPTRVRVRKRARREKDEYSRIQYSSFDERCNQLLRFKEEYGHCNVRQKYTGANPTLGKWCTSLRVSYNKIQKGMAPDRRLPQERIERLENIGFEWQDHKTFRYEEGFEKRCSELIAFKEESGHCNVPARYSKNLSLGGWCSSIRNTYNKMQQGKDVATLHILSQHRIERLEKIGFQWKVVDYDGVFENHCRELIAFKEEFGHCHVPRVYPSNQSLGTWCDNLRSAYRHIQDGIPTKRSLLPDRIERLEKIGFQWVCGNKKDLKRPASTSNITTRSTATSS